METTALAYPIANTAHVLGVILLVGVIGLLDLRLLGYGRGVSAAALSAAALPLAAAGFALAAASGTAMFLADVRALAASPLFLAKLGLIGLAGLNALAFRCIPEALAEPAPPRAKIAALASLILWIGAVILGRLIAYL
jgi:hypothetical protein